MGTIDGDRVTLATDSTEFHGDNLAFVFSGSLTGNTLSGSIDMGEYLTARWTARPTCRPAHFAAAAPSLRRRDYTP